VLGEDVGAFVVRKPDASYTDTDLFEFCADRLADYKRPRHICFVDELPRNATGKVMKHKLREVLARDPSSEAETAIITTIAVVAERPAAFYGFVNVA
jgi:acyl-CoA synthetase (AMP-forming)/AMP-acid ligase II